MNEIQLLCAHRAGEAVLTARGVGREALERLTTLNDAADTAAPDGWRELAGFLSDAWDVRRGAVEALLAQSQRVTDWRAVSGLDADSILEERGRYAQVRATLPAGAELAAPPT